MNVKQLIQNLEKYPEDMEVYYNDWLWDATPVEALEAQTVEDGDEEVDILLLNNGYLKE